MPTLRGIVSNENFVYTYSALGGSIIRLVSSTIVLVHVYRGYEINVITYSCDVFVGSLIIFSNNIPKVYFVAHVVLLRAINAITSIIISMLLSLLILLLLNHIES